ncbi:MAG: hypothetical protein ACOC46_03230 [Pirellulales bacterium]
MTALAVAYSIVVGGIALYVVRLGERHRRLEEGLAAVVARLGPGGAEEQPPPRAA